MDLWLNLITEKIESAMQLKWHSIMFFSITILKREMFKQPVWQMILHVFNHGTYHRGQLINMLRQLGVEKISQTDFIVWSRKK